MPRRQLEHNVQWGEKFFEQFNAQVWPNIQNKVLNQWWLLYQSSQLRSFILSDMLMSNPKGKSDCKPLWWTATWSMVFFQRVSCIWVCWQHSSHGGQHISWSPLAMSPCTRIFSTSCWNVFSEARNISTEISSRLVLHKFANILFLHHNLPKLHFDCWHAILRLILIKHSVYCKR